MQLCFFFRSRQNTVEIASNSDNMDNDTCPLQGFKKLCETINLPIPDFKEKSNKTQVIFIFDEDKVETALQFMRVFEKRLIKSASRKSSKTDSQTSTIDNKKSEAIEARKRIFAKDHLVNQSAPDDSNLKLDNNPLTLVTQNKNKISALMEYAQKKKMELPVFTETHLNNSPFACQCDFNGFTEIGSGTSKKSAKEDAARLILLKHDIKSDSITKRIKPSPSIEELTTRFNTVKIHEKDIVSKVNEWCQKRQIPIPDYNIFECENDENENNSNLETETDFVQTYSSQESQTMTDSISQKGKSQSMKKYRCNAKYKLSNYHQDHPLTANRILDSNPDRLNEKMVYGDSCNSKKEAKKNCAKKLYDFLVEEK